MVRRGNSFENRELAKEAGRKGGRVRSDFKKLVHRKYCSPSCPFFDKCPLMPLALSEKNKTIMPNGRIVYPCLLRKSNEAVRRTIKRLFLEDEEGLLDELRDAIYHLKLKAAGAGVKEWMRYVETLLKAQSVIYGQKIKEEGELEVNININIIGGEDE